MFVTAYILHDWDRFKLGSCFKYCCNVCSKKVRQGRRLLKSQGVPNEEYHCILIPLAEQFLVKIWLEFTVMIVQLPLVFIKQETLRTKCMGLAWRVWIFSHYIQTRCRSSNRTVVVSPLGYLPGIPVFWYSIVIGQNFWELPHNMLDMEVNKRSLKKCHPETRYF